MTFRGSAIELLETDVERANQRALLAERHVESLTEQMSQVKSELQVNEIFTISTLVLLHVYHHRACSFISTM